MRVPLPSAALTLPCTVTCRSRDKCASGVPREVRGVLFVQIRAPNQSQVSRKVLRPGGLRFPLSHAGVESEARWFSFPFCFAFMGRAQGYRAVTGRPVATNKPVLWPLGCAAPLTVASPKACIHHGPLCSLSAFPWEPRDACVPASPAREERERTPGSVRGGIRRG